MDQNQANLRKFPYLIDQKFAQLGMLQPGQANFGPTINVPRPPSPEELLARRAALLQDPRALEKHGAVKQFMWGLTSPLTDTLARLGAIEAQPKPVGIGETIAHAAGGLLSWLAIGALLPIGGPIAAAIKPVAGLFGSAVAQKAVTTIGTAAITGGIYGAHTAWVREEPVPQGILQGMAFSAALGGLGFGVGQVLGKARSLPPTTAQYLAREMSKRKPILSTQDAISMAQAGRLGELLAAVPEERLAPAVEEVLERARQVTHPLPSMPKPTDRGLLWGAKFNKLPTHRKAEEILKALWDSPEVDTLFEPVLDVARAVKAPGSILKGRLANYGQERVRAIVKASSPAPLEVTPELTRSLSKAQRGAIAQITQARTLGEQFDLFENLRRNLLRTQRRILKKHGAEHFGDLLKFAADDAQAAKAVQAYSDSHALIQDLTWQLGHQVSKTVHLHPSVNLPDLTAVHDPGQAMATLKSLKEEIKAGRANLVIKRHPKLQNWLSKLNKDRGKSYTDTTFLPPEDRKEMQKVIAEIKAEGGTPVTVYHNLISFPVPDDIAAKDIPKFILEAKEIPAATVFSPISIHDSLALETGMFRPIPILGRWFTPIRMALGEGFTNQARSRIQQHQKFVDSYAKKIKDWLHMLGTKPGKESTEAAVRIGQFLEGTVPDELAGKLMAAGDDLAKLAGYSPDRAYANLAVAQLSKKHGVVKADLKAVWKILHNIASDPDKLESFKRYSAATGMPMEKFAAHHLLNNMLRRAGALTDKAAERAAQAFGLKSAKELKVAFQMRVELDKLFRKAGLDIDQYLPGYLPRFKEYSNKGYDDIIKAFRERGIPEKEIRGYLWMNELHREAKGIGYTYEADAFRAFSRYVVGYSKSRHFGDDFFEPWLKYFKKSNISRDRMELLRDVRHWMIGRPGETEKQLDAMINGFIDVINRSEWRKAWGARPTAELSALLSELQYLGGIGFNPFTAVKNLTQKLLALSSITDDGNPMHGLKWLAKARATKLQPKGKFYLQHCAMIDDRMFLENLQVREGAIERLLKRFGVSEPWTDKAGRFREKAYAMFRWSDISNVEDTWLAKLLYLVEAKKAPWADAVNLATKTTMATQFMYGFDSPWLYKTPVGRQVGVFMSWPINWAFMLWEQGTSGDIRRAISTVVTTAVAAEILTMTGLNFMSIHPVNTARGILPIALLEGEDRWPLAMRSAASIKSYIEALARGDAEAVDSALDSMKFRLRPLVPAGVMAGRVLDFIDIVKNDWRKYDRKGRLKYEVTPGEAIRGLIGPTKEAYKREALWDQISKMEANYRHTRAQAIQAFLNHDYVRFQKLQEQLIINFGRWIEPKDIRYELRLREMTARERQLISLPTELREPLLARYGR